MSGWNYQPLQLAAAASAGGATEATARVAHKIILDKTSLARIASLAVAHKSGSGRLANTVSFAAFNPTWWNASYFKRRKIEFGTSHSALTAGHQVNFEIFTGYEQLVGDNGINNEGLGGLPGIAYFNNCTYFAWMGYSSTAGANSRVYVRKYNQGTDSWSNVIDVCDIGTYFDGHFAPSIMVDSDGYIHLFYGCHNSDLKYRKSTNTEDVTAWGSEQIIGSGYDFTYPHPVEASNGDLYIFGRQYTSGKGYLVFYKSINRGASWSSPQTVVDYSSNYGGNSSVYVADVRIDSNGRCHVFFTFWDYYEAANLGRAVCYIYTDDYSSWYNIKGDWLGVTNTIPIDYGADCKVAVSPNFPSAGPYYGEGSITIDDFNRPYLFYYSWTSGIQEEARAYLAKWTGSSWSITELTALSGSPLMMNRRFTKINYVDHQGNIYCYGVVLPNTSEEYFGGELYLWRGANYGENWTHFYITKNTYGGAGILSGLPKIFDGHYRELAYCRGKNIYYLQDISYPYIRSDGDDVRIVLHRLGDTDIEIDRLPDRFNAEDTKIYFAINSNAIVPENLSQPHPYKAYYVYYSNYSASNPPRNVHNIFTYYENFEAYTSGSDLNSQGGWSGDAGIFKVCAYSDTTTYPDAHTQKLYGGKNFLVVNAPGGAKALSKSLSLNSHYVFISIWTDLSASGDKFYIELYDSGSSKYFRAGINYNLFSYMKSGGSWTDTAKGAATNNYHEIKIKINSSGVTFWGDGGSALLTNDNHITQCTSIKIGCDSISGKAIYDAIRVYPSVSSEAVLSLGTIEGEDTPATARLAGAAQLRYHRERRLAQITGGLQKSDWARLAERIVGFKTSLARLAESVSAQKVAIARLSQTILGDKIRTARLSEKIIGEATTLARLAEAIAGDKILTARVRNDLGLNKTAISRVAAALDLDKQSLALLAHIAVLEKEDIARIGNKVGLQYFRSIRLMNMIVADKIQTMRLANVAPTANMATVRLSEILNLDKAEIGRLAGAAVPNKILVARLAEYLATDKTVATRLAQIANIEAADYERLAHYVLTEKNIVVRLGEIIVPSKTVLSRIANALNLSAERAARLAHWAELDAVKFARIAERLDLNKVVTARLAHWAQLPATETVRLAQLIAGDKAATVRVPEFISLDKVLLARVAMRASGRKELVARLAEYISLSASGTARLAQAAAGNKIILIRLANALALQYEKVIRVAHIIVGYKTAIARVANRVPFYFQDLFGMHIASASMENCAFDNYENATWAVTGQEMAGISLENYSFLTLKLENPIMEIIESTDEGMR